MTQKEKLYQETLTNNYFLTLKIKELGVSYKYRGFSYLVDIQDLLINQNAKVKAFYKDVYPYIAEKHKKNECTIERDIRNLIDKLWEPILKNKLIVFWNKEKKPRCCEFIYLVKNYILGQVI
ncbi:MAG: hypothetical protein E7374_02030 [Clostridiales bacterium]|nr:hypothetical protein [Clostridiales bacterium]